MSSEIDGKSNVGWFSGRGRGAPGISETLVVKQTCIAQQRSSVAKRVALSKSCSGCNMLSCYTLDEHVEFVVASQNISFRVFADIIMVQLGTVKLSR